MINKTFSNDALNRIGSITEANGSVSNIFKKDDGTYEAANDKGETRTLTPEEKSGFDSMIGLIGTGPNVVTENQQVVTDVPKNQDAENNAQRPASGHATIVDGAAEREAGVIPGGESAPATNKVRAESESSSEALAPGVTKGPFQRLKDSATNAGDEVAPSPPPTSASSLGAETRQSTDKLEAVLQKVIDHAAQGIDAPPPSEASQDTENNAERPPGGHATLVDGAAQRT